MSLTLATFICLTGLYVGWNIGANDAANCIGASVGAGLIRYRTAIVLVALFVVAGAMLQGGEVIHTVGKGIVTDPIPVSGVIAALLCAGLFVTAATFFKIPVSTSQAVVGGVAGVGLASGLTVDWSKTIRIAECWVLCPILTAALTYVAYRLTRLVLNRLGESARLREAMRWLVLVSASYAAYSLGANNLGNAIGPIVALEVEALDIRLLTVLGALSIAAGALIFGKGVAETVGKSIIPLDLAGALSVQTSAAAGLHLFSMMGIPVSTSQAIVGGLMGVGLVHGARTVSKRKLVEIGAGWVLTPALAGVVAFGAYAVISRLS